MVQANGQGDVGQVQVFTSNEGGHSPEQIADMAVNKIIAVSETAPPPIRDQALAYRNNIKDVILYYMRKMAQSERTTMWALLRKQGHEDMAEIIRRL
jgi:hypothetical protein